jgi:hypothetical protein
LQFEINLVFLLLFFGCFFGFAFQRWFVKPRRHSYNILNHSKWRRIEKDLPKMFGDRLVFDGGHVYPSCRGRSSENMCSSRGGAPVKGKTGWNSGYHQNWWKKLVWVPVISFWKILIPSYMFDALLCQNWPFSPP